MSKTETVYDIFMKALSEDNWASYYLEKVLNGLQQKLKQLEQ